MSERYLPVPVPAAEALLQRPHAARTCDPRLGLERGRTDRRRRGTRILVETVCANGTPNEGFLVRGHRGTVTATARESQEATTILRWATAAFTSAVYDSSIQFPKRERFLSQTDWLQIDADLGNLPPLPPVTDLTRQIFIQVWTLCTCVAGSRSSQPLRIASCESGPWAGLTARRVYV